MRKTMKAVIVGGGKIGYFLAQTLDEKGYRVVVVEKCEKECLKLADELNIPVHDTAEQGAWILNL